MKTTLLKSVLFVAIAFASVLNFNVMAQDKFITNDVMTGELLTSKIIYRHNGSLYNHMKHDFKYDNENRVVEKETFKWDSNKEEWVPFCKINLNYSADQVVMDYGKWNKKEKAYTDAQERSVYALDGFSIPVAYQNYKWNNLVGEWKITNNVRFTDTNVLLADMK